MKAVRQQTDPPKSKKKKYSDDELILFATMGPRNPTEYGPIIRGKLNDNKLLVADYEAYLKSKGKQ